MGLWVFQCLWERAAGRYPSQVGLWVGGRGGFPYVPPLLPRGTFGESFDAVLENTCRLVVVEYAFDSKIGRQASTH